MEIITCLTVFGVIYVALLFFDTFFKTCAHYPYIQFLHNTGFEIGFLRVKWKTVLFNRFILRLANDYTRVFNYWFTSGCYCTIALFPFVVGFLLFANYQLLASKGVSDKQQLVLEPLIPGYNLPVTEIGYYAFTLLICSIFHEIGHALAAVKEDVHLIDIGINCLLFIPVAYVNISAERLAAVGHWRALRILCAGIWHNIVLVLVAGLVYTLLPFLLSPLYSTEAGIMVTDVMLQSPLAGVKGLHNFNTITGINDCVIKNENDWKECLSRVRTVRPGYCITTNLYHDVDETSPLTQLPSGAWDCCTSSNSQNMCFEYLEKTGGIAELPPHMCLPVRHVVESSKMYCYSTRHCPENWHCIRPVLANTTFLMVFNRLNEPVVIYTGHPADVFLTITISSFIPKVTFPGVSFADVVCRLLKYLIVFSSGLVVINILPCLFFDGQHIITSLLALLLKNRMKRQKIQTVSMVTIIVGTILLLFNFIYTMLIIIFKV